MKIVKITSIKLQAAPILKAKENPLSVYLVNPIKKDPDRTKNIKKLAQLITKELKLPLSRVTYREGGLNFAIKLNEDVNYHSAKALVGFLLHLKPKIVVLCGSKSEDFKGSKDGYKKQRMSQGDKHDNRNS